MDISKTNVNHITIIGLGLMGGSWALALRQAQPHIQIHGVDTQPQTLERALDLGIIDKATIDPLEGVVEADVVIVATLVSTIAPIIQQIASHTKPGCIVTDVGSTKGSILAQLESKLPGTLHFIGGHPMAGTEHQGLEAARVDLYHQAPYILTPQAGTPETALQTLSHLIECIGAQVIIVAPSHHDELVAAISHLPYILSTALVRAIGGLPQGKQAKALAAGGFKDTTRIALSPPMMWADILLDNGPQVLTVLHHFQQALGEMQDAIEHQNRTMILSLLAEAQASRQTLS